MVDRANDNFYVKYNNFATLPEIAKYKLHVSSHMYETAGDSLEYHNNMKLTTKDQDNGNYSTKNCAVTHNANGGWWYKYYHTAQHCSTSKDYYNVSSHKYTPGPVWLKFHGNFFPLRSATMMFREKY